LFSKIVCVPQYLEVKPLFKTDHETCLYSLGSIKLLFLNNCNCKIPSWLLTLTSVATPLFHSVFILSASVLSIFKVNTSLAKVSLILMGLILATTSVPFVPSSPIFPKKKFVDWR